MSPTKIDNDATNSWNSYFKNRLGKKAIQNDCCFNNEDYQSVVYAIFSQDKLIYIGRSNDFEHRKTGHLREVLIQFFFRFVTPKAAEIFRVLVPELEKDFLHHQNDERLILNVDTSSQHLSFLPMKTGISQFEATVLEAELIKLFYGRLTNVKKESLHVDPVLGDEVRKIYSKNIYDHAIRLSKNEGNLHTFNLWEFISSGRFAPNVFSKTELDTLARQMKENGLFDFASSQNDNGEIHEFLEKISSLLQKKSLKDIIRVLGPELKKMDEIKYHSGAIEKPTENPMFALFKRPLNFATSSHLELFHIPSPSKENFTPPDRNLVQKIILTDYDDCQISEPVFSEFTFFIHKSIDETRRIKGMEKFILRRGGNLSSTFSEDAGCKVTHIVVDENHLSEKDFDELNKRGVICSEIKSHLTSSYKVLSFVNDVWFRGVLETKNKYSPGITLCR